MFVAGDERSSGHSRTRDRGRERAASKGRSTEAEHREILREALSRIRRGTSLKSLLTEMPDAGDDADFARPRAKARKVRL